MNFFASQLLDDIVALTLPIVKDATASKDIATVIPHLPCATNNSLQDIVPDADRASCLTLALTILCAQLSQLVCTLTNTVSAPRVLLESDCAVVGSLRYPLQLRFQNCLLCLFRTEPKRQWQLFSPHSLTSTCRTCMPHSRL